MRLFSRIFSTLAIQALVASLLVGGLLVALLYQSHATQLEQRDREALRGFAATVAETARARLPLDRPVRELDARGERLSGRVALVTPQGAPIAGPLGDPRAEHAIEVDGRTVAVARIVRPPEMTDADRRSLAVEGLAALGIALALGLGLLIAGRLFARRWSAPQEDVYRLSREVVQGEHELDFDETGPPEIVGTMRNLHRIANQFSRIEASRRTWLIAIAEELQAPAENMGEHFISLCELESPPPLALLHAMEVDTHRLIHIAEDLSAVASADLGRLPVRFDEIDAAALIRQLIRHQAPRAAAQRISLEAGALPDEPVTVNWDSPRIEQLIDALIDNSLRYTPSGGRIRISLESARDAWRVIVDDSAPGVDVMLAQHLFEPFYRSADRMDEPIASGLALATARAIVEAHLGRIEASQSPIGGLRVTVTLPANPPSS